MDTDELALDLANAVSGDESRSRNAQSNIVESRAQRRLACRCDSSVRRRRRRAGEGQVAVGRPRHRRWGRVPRWPDRSRWR
jgi:hypothetical protein